MKVYSIKVPTPSRYAELLNLYVDTPYTICPQCGQKQSEELGYIECEWEEGSDQIGDFVFTIGPVVLKERIADQILARFSGFSKGEVRMHDHPNLRRPAKSAKSVPNRVWLPYDGPPLCYMKMTKEVEFHPSSTVEVESTCTECGVISYKRFDGIERRNSRIHKLREEGKGFFFNIGDLGNCDFFRPRHTGFTLCTEKARQFIMDLECRNVEFREVGETLPDDGA